MTTAQRQRPPAQNESPAQDAPPDLIARAPAPASPARKPRVHAAATAVPVSTHGRPVGLTDVTVRRDRAIPEVTVDTADCTYRIPLDAWIHLVRTTVTPRELWPAVS